jgi:predicted helicase
MPDRRRNVGHLSQDLRNLIQVNDQLGRSCHRLPKFSIFHVNGSQHSSQRKQLICDFREAKKALITNARCLTEGIDVPAVDMVGFIDPRHSKIDIAQATGRAMRKLRGSDARLYRRYPYFSNVKATKRLSRL